MVTVKFTGLYFTENTFLIFQSKNSLCHWYTNLHDFSSTAKLVQLSYDEVLIIT